MRVTADGLRESVRVCAGLGVCVLVHAYVSIFVCVCACICVSVHRYICVFFLWITTACLQTTLPLQNAILKKT